jgi:hypothetical protein
MRLYMTFRRTEPVPIAAAKAGFSTATAYRIEQDPRPPSDRTIRRERRRPDPLMAIWDSEVVPLLLPRQAYPQAVIGGLQLRGKLSRPCGEAAKPDLDTV